MLNVALESQDIQRMDIMYREKTGITYGYAVVNLKEQIGSIRTFHFTFSMPTKDFEEKIPALEKSAKKGGFQLKMQQKSRISIAIEQRLASVLAGTAYRNRGCPACQMIDAFVARGSSS